MSIQFKTSIEKYMEFNLSKEDDDMVTLEFICEEIHEQFKLILELVARYKQKKPHLKQQFKAKKHLLFQILHDESSNHLEVRKNFAFIYI